MPVPFKVKAVYEYNSPEPDDLNFPNGQVITVTEEDDADWYTGEYIDADGQPKSGLFPRNFVERYEPAIPSRPVRSVKKPAPAEPVETATAPPPPHHEERIEAPPPPLREAQVDPPPPLQQPTEQEKPASTQATNTIPPQQEQPEPTFAARLPPAVKAAPPVAQKPTSSSFKDRIAAFNKPAAPPVAPFKPGGQTSSTFIKKPFVAPPPSKNAYVPPPREVAPQTVYRREEDPSLHQQEPADATHPASEAVPKEQGDEDEDQPKPTSLKDRIALLQKQQAEQAQRTTEKKKKVERPPQRRVESPEPVGEPAEHPEPSLARVVSNDTATQQAPAQGAVEVEPLPRLIQRQPSARSTTIVPQPASELVSDANDADESGAAEEDDGLEESTEEDRPKSKGSMMTPASVPKHDAAEEEGEEDEEVEEDPEVRRKRELRERMMKMSGGMGMMGMFGPGPGATPPRKPKATAPTERHEPDAHDHDEEVARAPPVPIMALPGMSNVQRRPHPAEPDDVQDETAQPTPREPAHQPETNEDYVSQPPTRSSTDRAVPPVPQGPRLVSEEARAPPPPPPGGRPMPALPPMPSSPMGPMPALPPMPPGGGGRAMPSLPPMPSSPRERPVPPPPPPTSIDVVPHPSSARGLDTAQVPLGAPLSNEYEEAAPNRRQVPPVPSDHPPVASPSRHDSFSASSPISDKRMSRGPPPLPTSPTSPPPQNRGPPPPPPGQPPSRTSTYGSQGLASQKHEIHDDSEDEVTEYDGDYDTDIASSAKHKDALKSHNRDSSLDEGASTDDATGATPVSPPTRAMPPVPPGSAPRGVPPPPPQTAPVSRKSVDAPRAPPPPVPPTRMNEEEEYDPFRYSAPQFGVPSPSSRVPPYSPGLQSPVEEPEEDDLYQAATEVQRPPAPPSERAAPPPPSSMAGAMAMPDQRTSLDVRRTSSMRYSSEQSRAEEHGFIAHDIDLAQNSLWWTQDGVPPPALQGRTDVLYEMDASTSTKRGGKATVSKDIYVLYMDYSQSAINTTFDAANPAHATLEQSHQGPPRPPRRDQLESASEAYGLRVSRAAGSAFGNTIGDGSAHAFVIELLRPLTDVLPPIGLRAYGALVYANLANASTQQNDEIRPGDIVTFRNARFSGHKGNLHQKYILEAGRPDHVGVVIDWDGTKKKIRAWEQRGEEKGKRAKVREESFRLGDLRSGEVRVWRLMPRSWVGWDKS